MRVRVYWNLHKDCYSVTKWVGGPDKGRVVAYLDEIRLEDVKFIVQPAGRERVLREKRKNVHAFLEGFWGDPEVEQVGATTIVSYNPYQKPVFYRKDDGGAVESASWVTLTSYASFKTGKRKALLLAAGVS
jgi:hypothetical protein